MIQELNTDILIVGGGLGGVAAALGAARSGRRVILTEETRWLGGQATTQGVPLDEHPWIEDYGRTLTYQAFREGVRTYYRRHYPLIDQAHADRHLNPGAGWVSALCFEPRVGLAVIDQMLAPHVSAGRIKVLIQHRPVAVTTEGDRFESVTLRDDTTGYDVVVGAPYVLDATELGELLELGRVEHVVGAESQTQTGEPNALAGEANPLDQMGFTHVFAVDYQPGEDHTIDRPRDYDRWRTASNAHTGQPKLAVRDLFGHKVDHLGRAPRPGHYLPSTWSFRRMLSQKNFKPGAFDSDVTVAIWAQNEYHDGVLCGVSTEEQQRHFNAARQLSLSVLYWLQTEAPNPVTGSSGFPGLRPRGDVFGTTDGLAQYPYIRESRRLVAEKIVTENDFRTDRPGQESGPVDYADSIGLGGYRIDIHKPQQATGRNMTELNHGKHWCQQVPLGALIPVRVENLLPACKNLGVTSVVNGAFRLHPVEWNIGEAAGLLAAFCLDRDVTPRQVRNTVSILADFQRVLVAEGVELAWPQQATARSYFSHHNLEIGDADTFYFGEAERL